MASRGNWHAVVNNFFWFKYLNDCLHLFDFSQSPFDPIPSVLSGMYEITALTYSPKVNTVFWGSGPEIWKISCSEKSQKQFVGRVENTCAIDSIAYDWLTGLFYLVCGSSQVFMCSLQVEPIRMLCKELFDTHKLNISSISLDSNTGWGDSHAHTIISLERPAEKGPEVGWYLQK